MRQSTGVGWAGTPTLSIACVNSLHTGSTDSCRLVATGVGPSTTYGDGAPLAVVAAGRVIEKLF